MLAKASGLSSQKRNITTTSLGTNPQTESDEKGVCETLAA